MPVGRHHVSDPAAAGGVVANLPYIAALAAYAFVAFVHLLPGSVGPWAHRSLRAVGLFGALIHAATLALAIGVYQRDPGFPEALSAASLGIVTAWFLVGRNQLSSLGMLLAPLAVVILGTSLFVPHRQVAALDGMSGGAMAPVHLGLMVAGLAGFAVSFAVGLGYLVVRRRLKRRKLDGFGRLPSLETLDRIQFRSTLFGFVFLTLGIGTGGAWAAATLPEPWVTDPKVWFTLVIWAWYAVALQVRLVAGWRGRWSALFAIVGFGGMVFSLIALDFLVTGFHAYGG
jgi:ABC-type transport system involved in cytochrome c biogenesis permease subunit